MRKKLLFAVSLALAFAVGFGACLGVDTFLRARLGTPEETATPAPAAESPLPETASPGENIPASSAAPEPLPSVLGTLSHAVEAIIGDASGLWDIYVIDLDTGKEQRWAETAGGAVTEPQPAASECKLFIAGAVHRRLETAEGESAGAVDRYLGEMLSKSDNGAANALLAWLGGSELFLLDDASLAAGLEAVNAFCREEGFAASSMGRSLGAAAESPETENYTSSADCAAFLARVARGELVSDHASAEILADLTAQERRDKIPAGVLGAGWTVANKTGEILAGDGGYTVTMSWDAAVVSGPRNYVLVVMARPAANDQEGYAQAVEMTVRISQAAFAAFSGQNLDGGTVAQP